MNVRLIGLLSLAGFALIAAVSALAPSLRAQMILGAYATVRVAEVNVRTGPGAGFAILDTVQEGQAVAVIGRLSDCSWLQVVRPGKGEGWVASPLVILSRACRDLPLVAGPMPVAAQPTPSQTAPVARAAVAEVGQPAPTTTAPAAASVAGCTVLPDEQYGAVTVNGPPSRLPAAAHPDLNLALRGYEPSSAPTALIHIDGPVDSGAPQLTGLFADRRRATVTATYQVYDWDWECDCRGALTSEAEATLVGLQMMPGETIYTPDSPRTIGSGYEALVLYATTDHITIKFTREDNVVSGYTLHVEGICVEPGLLARYRALDGAGRKELPALRGGQPFGRARNQAVIVAIRDNGQFLDPRGRPHWWR